MKNIQEKYSTLMKKRKCFYWYALAMPLVLGLASIWIGEDNIFLLFIPCVILFCIWSLVLYFSLCPSCGGLFFGASFKVRGQKVTISHPPLLLNSACNQCGYPEKSSKPIEPNPIDRENV